MSLRRIHKISGDAHVRKPPPHTNKSPSFYIFLSLKIPFPVVRPLWIQISNRLPFKWNTAKEFWRCYITRKITSLWIRQLTKSIYQVILTGMLPERFKSTPGFTIDFLLLLLCSEFQWNSVQNKVRFGRHPTVPSQAH